MDYQLTAPQLKGYTTKNREGYYLDVFDLQAKTTLLWGEKQAAMIAVSSEVTTDTEAAQALLADFLAQFPDFSAMLVSAQWKPLQP